MDRRGFIKKLGTGSLLLTSGALPLQAFEVPGTYKLTILHTNDVHSRIDPFPMDGGRFQGLGGASRRAALIKKIRNEEEHVLLLDAGDIFQGTPYFNYFSGELEFKLMSEMGYDAATIGNHDFDAGIDGLYKQLPHSNFPLVICNYDFKDTVMAGKVHPYRIFHKGPIKIGVTGVGIELDGLVPKNLYKETVYNEPISKVNEIARLLKQDEKCDLVICLSHLGFRYRSEKVSDIVLAENSENIDLIIGGHTHTFLDQPEVLKNRQGKPVMVNQVGWAGIALGRLDIFFEKNKKQKCVNCKNHWVK